MLNIMQIYNKDANSEIFTWRGIVTVVLICVVLKQKQYISYIYISSKPCWRTGYTPNLALASFRAHFLQPISPWTSFSAAGSGWIKGIQIWWKQWGVIFHFFHLQHLATVETILSNPSVLTKFNPNHSPFRREHRQERRTDQRNRPTSVSRVYASRRFWVSSYAGPASTRNLRLIFHWSHRGEGKLVVKWQH